MNLQVQSPPIPTTNLKQRPEKRRTQTHVCSAQLQQRSSIHIKTQMEEKRIMNTAPHPSKNESENPTPPSRHTIAAINHLHQRRQTFVPHIHDTLQERNESYHKGQKVGCYIIRLRLIYCFWCASARDQIAYEKTVGCE